jgi:hypothetical protein
MDWLVAVLLVSGMVTLIAAVHYTCGLVMRLKLEEVKMASTWFL